MSRSARWLIVVAAVGLGAAAFYFAGERWYGRGASACASLLAGDPHRGGQLFSSRGCNACHPLFGTGPAIGPDLGQQQPGGWRPVRTVAAMWNHGPEIWQKLKEARMGYLRISERDVLDLLAFLGSLQYMDEPGDAGKGRELFASKICARCHDLAGSGHRVGPDLSRLDVDTPILWAQRMWNHSDAMSALLAKENIPWPTFAGKEMVDLLAYVRSVAKGVRREGSLWPADPQNGRRLFAAKSCETCHAINGRGGTLGPDLGPRRSLPPTMTELAGLMWNHAPHMWKQIKVRGLVRPKFEEREMADLIAFLYQVRYLEPQGDAALGRRVFERKRCAACHGADGRGGGGGPDLLGAKRTFCATRMAYAMWSHGPQMYKKMQQSALAWPNFDEQEMVHLMSFLNRQ